VDLEVVDRVVLDAVELVVAEASPGVVVREAMLVQESHQARTSRVRLHTQVEVEKMREEAEVANEAATVELTGAARNSTRHKGEVGIKAPKTRRRRSNKRKSLKLMKA